MAALIVSDIFTRLKRIFGDESGVQVVEADVIRWINDAQREAVMQHEGLLQTEGLMNTVLNQQVYVLPTDLFTLSHAYYMESSTYYALRYMSIPEFDEYINGWAGSDYGNGAPMVYTRVKANEITLFPKPDRAVTNGLKFIYSRYPTDATAGSSAIDLPQYYHSFVEHFCMMKVYEMDEDWEASSQKATLLQSTLDFNNNRESWFGRDSYPAVMPTSEDY